MDALAVADPAIITIHELIDSSARRRGAEVFLISPATGRTLTYAGLGDETRAVAALLRQAGLKPGDKAAFLMDNGLFTVQLFLGTMYGGMVSVPLNVRAGAAQLAYTIEHCDAKVVFVEDQYAALAEEALAGCSRTVQLIPTDIDAFATDLGAPLTDVPHAPAAEDVALLMYTSGSVGQPKAAIHSHRTILAHGRNSMTSHELTPADRALLVLPIYHINAECVTLMPTLMSGGSVIVPRHFGVSQFWDWLEDYRCTWSAVVPTIISQLLDWKDARAGQREGTFRRVRFIRSSSAPLSPSLQHEFMAKFPIRLIQAMGSSEAGNIFANPQAPGANKIGSPGRAWGFETRIVNPEGADVPSGEPGEVLLRGPAVTRGYYKDAEQTAAVFDQEGWLHTGDLAYQDQDGYFFIIGRSKELIIKGGMNIAPRQIDEVLESHPAVLEAAVVGVPDHYLGEDLIAFAILRSDAKGDEKGLLAFCERHLGHFKTPTRIHFVADLPKGPSGKVQRLRLLEEAVQLAAAAPSYNNGHIEQALPAAGAIEETIQQSWAEALGMREVGLDANFFALGGHSLMAIQCLSRMREKLTVALSLADFFEHPTIAQQVNLVKERLDIDRPVNGQGRAQSAEDTRSQPIPLREDRSSHPLSSGQRRLWFFEELAPEVPLYNESETVRLLGELQPDAIERALNLIVARHEILRTTIKAAEQGPMAAVHESWPLRIKRIDLGGLAPAERAAEVERLLIDEPRLPYHLDSAPGIRATLIRLGSSEHVFILMMHHLVCDWASEGVLWRELSTAYRAIVRGEQPAFAKLPIQYGDYSVWQQRRIAEVAFTEDLDFWEDHLRGAPELLELPADRPRPSVQSYRGARQRFRLSAALTEALRNCSREEETSLFTIFAAALETLLYRYTGSEDIVLGIPLAEREHQELQSLIGFLLHVQALRTKLNGDMTFRELLALVRKGSVALYSHREVPFEQVVGRLRPERSLSHSPIFQVMINWRDQDQHLSYIGLDGLQVESLLSETRTAKFDLTLQLTDFGDQVWLEAEYSTDLFDHDRIARMFGHYQTILEAAAANPEQKLAALPLLTEAERKQLIAWNATEAAYPRELCIHQLFEAQAERTPDAVAVVFGDQQVTYDELNQRANQLARHLRKLGVKPEDLVAIALDRSIEMMIGLLGILKAGGAYVPLDPSYPRERLAFMLEDSRVALVLTQNHLRDSLPGGQQRVCLDSDWPAIAAEATSNLEPAAHPGSLAYVIYTSGSTGRPKGVEIAHRSAVNLLSSMRKRPGLDPSDTLLAVTTLSFDMSVVELFLPLTVGAKLVIASRETASQGEALLDLLRKSEATVIQATPITFRLLLDAEWSPGDARIKVWCGGEALQRALADRMLERATELWNCYGPTETTVYASMAKVPPYGLITIGKPPDNTQLYILDAHGEPCPIGKAGELHVGGDCLARGYLRQPELTAAKFVMAALGYEPPVRMYKTGDLARLTSDGDVECLGRIDHQIKLRGFRIELEEIEAVLAEHPRVTQCVVVAREDAAGDKRLAAYVVPADPKTALPIDELRERLKRKLPEYMVPAAFVITAKLPLTANGKIDRKALPAPELEGASSAAAYVAPRTPLEEVLAGIWRRVMGLTRVGIRDDFFDLGGDSLTATRLIAEVHKSLNRRLSIAAFFQNSNIEAMARALREPGQGESGHQSIALKPASSPGSLFFLDAGIGLCRLAGLLNEAPSSYATGVPLDAAALQTAALNPGSDLPTLQNIAAAHVALIRSRHRSGPCLLAGYSFGGVLAFEVAHQLQRQGIAVRMILLLDSWARSPIWWQKLKVLSMGQEGTARSRSGHLWSRLHAMLTDGGARLGSLSKSYGASPGSSDQTNIAFGEAPPIVSLEFLRGIRKAYRYRQLDCHAVLFRCTDDLYSTHVMNGGMGWAGLFGNGLEIIETPGNHESLLQEPHLHELAFRVDDRLARMAACEPNEWYGNHYPVGVAGTSARNADV
jgi:amino acid adenylation domain-containing protein